MTKSYLNSLIIGELLMLKDACLYNEHFEMPKFIKFHKFIFKMDDIVVERTAQKLHLENNQENAKDIYLQILTNMIEYYDRL